MNVLAHWKIIMSNSCWIQWINSPKHSQKKCQEIIEKNEHDVNLKYSSKHEGNETLTSKIHQFLTSKHLPQGELCAH